MKKSKEYKDVFFRPEHLSRFAEVFRSRMDEDERGRLSLICSVNLPGESWGHDQETEFFSDILKPGATYHYRLLGGPYDLILDFDYRTTRAVVAAPERSHIEAVFQTIEENSLAAQLPPVEDKPTPRKVSVFIGHGRNEQWRDLKDHLHEQHGFDVEAYEIGARAGHAIRDVLEHMLDSSSIAFLLMTGEEETTDGRIMARQNVVHEIGLFQGHLGFTKAIVLLEQGVDEFSNIHGIQQIRFGRGSIRETFGDIVATIRREFPDGNA